MGTSDGESCPIPKVLKLKKKRQWFLRTRGNPSWWHTQEHKGTAGLVGTVRRAGLGSVVDDPRVTSSGSVLGSHLLLFRGADKGECACIYKQNAFKAREMGLSVN